MKKPVLSALLLVWTVFCGQAQAEIYNYTGPIQRFGGHVTATVDVSYIGPGAYVEGGGPNSFFLNSLTLNAFDASNSLVLSLSRPGNATLRHAYIFIDGSGSVTNWNIQVVGAVTIDRTEYIETIGNDIRPYSNGGVPFDNTDYWDFTPRSDRGPGGGVWTISAVPEPDKFVLFGVGLGLIGWSCRRKQKVA